MTLQEIEQRLEKHRKDFREVGGYDNEMVSCPAGGVREFLATLEAAVELLRAGNGSGPNA